MKTKIIAIVGPTASGKSGLALELAKKYNGEILCVDSRTVYRGMDIGTAKTMEARITKFGGYTNYEYVEIDGVKNYGLDLVDPDGEMNGAVFKEYGEKVIIEIVSRGRLPILVGGTGLWMDMVIYNIESPEVGPDLALRADLENKNTDELFAEYQKLDPIGAKEIDRKNKRRLVRALEVCKKTGRPFSVQRQKGEERYDTLWLGIEVEKNVLKERIDHRVDEMIEQGLINEVKELNKKFGCDVYSMSGIGYQEICEYLNDHVETHNCASLHDAINKIKIHTCQYAKRQMTWFKRNKNIHWIRNFNEADDLVGGFL